jgi:Sulfotransferase domain
MPGWTRLCRKKWHCEPNDDVSISAAEFDELIGHCTAVADAARSCFAAELIAAYPEAKVVLNVRRDLDAWHRSAVKTILGEVERIWVIWFLKWFTAQGF